MKKNTPNNQMKGQAFSSLFMLFACIILMALSPIRCSRGDEDPDYRSCLANCLKSRQCTANPGSTAGLPLHMRLMGWNCSANCKYDCMWHVIEQRRAKGLPVHQYHGKWPFIRFLGFQEFASALFSAGNAVAHYVGYRQFRRSLGPGGLHRFYLSKHYLVYFAASILAWCSAFVFHTRDVPWTEHADYLTAITSIFVALYNAVLRHLNIIEPKYQLLTALPFICLLGYHLHYMLCVTFNYGWNMELLASMFAAFSLLWLIYGIRNFRKSLQAKMAVLWVVGACACGALEIFDFEPIGDFVDAHALWHAGTIPLVLLIWKVYAMDAEAIVDSHDKAREEHSI